MNASSEVDPIREQLSNRETAITTLFGYPVKYCASLPQRGTIISPLSEGGRLLKLALPSENCDLLGQCIERFVFIWKLINLSDTKSPVVSFGED